MIGNYSFSTSDHKCSFLSNQFEITEYCSFGSICLEIERNFWKLLNHLVTGRNNAVLSHCNKFTGCSCTRWPGTARIRFSMTEIHIWICYFEFNYYDNIFEAIKNTIFKRSQTCKIVGTVVNYYLYNIFILLEIQIIFLTSIYLYYLFYYFRLLFSDGGIDAYKNILFVFFSVRSKWL